MATSSMIQYLDAPGTDVGPSNRRVTERFFATGAIAIGDFVWWCWFQSCDRCYDRS